MVLPNLSKTKVEVKKLFVKGLFVLAGLIVVFILINILTTIKNWIFPDPSLRPQHAFGILPAIPFPNNTDSVNLTYSLDTITGLLPDFQKIVKVYKIIPVKTDLLAVQRAQDKVSRIGFTNKGTAISKDSFQWVEQNPPQTITINIFSSDFIFLTPYLTSENMQTFNNSAELKMTTDKANSFLDSMSLFPKDIDKEKTKTTYYSIKDNALFPASSISNTNIVRVDFFQKDIDGLPVYYEKISTSSIYLLVGKKERALNIVEAHYSYKNLSEESSTYAIKTAAEAFIELKQGNAYIAERPQSNNISIKDVSLGYYMGEGLEEFLIPVIVFQGDNFIAYVSAITDEWINN